MISRRISPILFTLICLCCSIGAFAQPVNDNCANATQLCEGTSVSSTTTGATTSTCAGCPDAASNAGNFCYGIDNTVWFMFTTNTTGGNVQVDISNMSCVSTAGFDDELQGVIVAATSACDESTYTLVSNCATSSGAFALTAAGLAPNTTYYVQIDGDLNGAGITDPANCGFDIIISGPAVEEPTQAILNSSSTSVCENEQVDFNVETPDCEGQSSYTWFVNGSPVSTGTDSTLSYSGGADYTVSVECTCLSTVCQTPYTSNTEAVAVENVPVDAGEDAVIIEGGSTVLDGSGTGTLVWSPGTDLSSTTTTNPTASPGATTTYFLTATSATGCTSTDEVVVTVILPISVPNAITPNGDGHNDIWDIFRISTYPNAKVTVYDRWGQRVFNVVGYTTDKRWDGTFSGKALPAGTYFYFIDLNTEVAEDIYKGTITIIY